MKTNLEEISPVKKKLFIEIDPEEVDRKFNQAYRDLGKKAKVPGFRPGKVPRSILEGRFRKQVTEDVTRDLISDTLPKALDEVKTFPLGTPVLEKETLKQGEIFKYSAVMEVRPEFEVKDYLGVEVEKGKCLVTEEDVSNQLEQIRKSHGKLTTVEEDRPIQRDDYVILDYEGYEGGQPLVGVKAPNFLVKVGSEDFHPRFEESLIGLKKGDESEIEVDFGDTYYHSKLAGKRVKFKVEIKDIKEMVLPELNDEFSQTLGTEFEDLEGLKRHVRKMVTEQEEKRIESDLRDRLMERTSERLEFKLPQVLVDAEIAHAVENLRQNLERNGSSFEKAGLSEDKLKGTFRPPSEQRVKEMLILAQIAEQDGIKVDEEDLEEGFKEIASNMGQDSETIRKYYEAKNLVPSLQQTLLEQKTLNYLVEHAMITEVDKESLNQNNPKEGDQ
ncbi:MAG: trigger factor [Desulfobacteraceae bacterium]|nr:trigger factor [Desulfobacteraceae bacterium]